MTEPLQVGQFAIVDHEPVDRGPNAGVFHGKGPVDDRAELYLVAEGTTPAGEAFAGHVVSALGQAFASLDMSLTGSMQRLFAEAARNLQDWNRKSIAQHRVSIGLGCFGRRGDQAVIAQAGPSAVFHLSAGEVHAYYTDEEHGRPIGAGSQTVPQFTRIEFAPGDRVLLLSTAALNSLDEEIVGGILALPGAQVIPDLYRRLEHLRHVTAVLIMRPEEHVGADASKDLIIDATTGPGATLHAATEPAESSEAFQPSLFITDEAGEAVQSARLQLREVTMRSLEATAVPVLMSDVPRPLRRAVGDDTLVRLAAESRARFAMAQAALSGGRMAAAGGGGRPHWRGASTVEHETPPSADSRRKQRLGSFSRGLVHEETPPRPDPNVEGVPLVDELAEDRRARASLAPAAAAPLADDASITLANGSMVRVRDSMGGRWKGNGALSSRSIVAGQMPPTWLVVVVGLAILLALVGLITVPRMLDGHSGERYAELVDGAQQRLATARAQQDPTERRKQLTEAQAMLLEAIDLDSATPSAQQLIAEVKAAIATMDAIKEPASVETIASLEQFGDKPIVVSRLTLGDDAAYILDSASQRVIAITFSTGERKIAFTEDKEARRGRPIASAYIDNADFGSALLVADTSRQIFAYSAQTGLRQLALGAPGGMNITDIAVFGRDLYVLDAGGGAVYRFAQADGGFGQAPVKVLETPELSKAVRLNVDSEIITTDSNGTLRRFPGQLSLVLSEAGIDKRLVAPEVAQPLARNGDLAVLDAPNSRIVVLRRDGTFDRQYRHKDFQAMSAFAVRNGTAYVFGSGVLRRVTW